MIDPNTEPQPGEAERLITNSLELAQRLLARQQETKAAIDHCNTLLDRIGAPRFAGPTVLSLGDRLEVLGQYLNKHHGPLPLQIADE